MSLLVGLRPAACSEGGRIRSGDDGDAGSVSRSMNISLKSSSSSSSIDPDDEVESRWSSSVTAGPTYTIVGFWKSRGGRVANDRSVLVSSSLKLFG